MPRVALAYDSPSRSRQARAIARYASPHYEVHPIAQSAFAPNDVYKYDGVLWMSWPTCPPPPFCRNMWSMVANSGCMFEHFPKSIVYEHRTASKSKNSFTARTLLPRFRGVININPRAKAWLESLDLDVKTLSTGVDTDEFRVLTPPRDTGPLRIGWCGKYFPGNWTPKGYEEILQPVMKRFEGDRRVSFTVNTNSHKNAIKDMAAWYNNIDLLLVTSVSEGTPSVLLEAAACGRAFISTDVGIASKLVTTANQIAPAPESVGDEQSTVERICKSIQAFASVRRHEIASIGRASRGIVLTDFNWETLAAKWLDTICS
jgi:hypothetical protein